MFNMSREKKCNYPITFKQDLDQERSCLTSKLSLSLCGPFGGNGAEKHAAPASELAR